MSRLFEGCGHSHNTNPPTYVRVLALFVTACLGLLQLGAAPASAPASAPAKSTIVLRHTAPGVGVTVTVPLAAKLGVAPGLYRVYTVEEWRELIVMDHKLSLTEELVATLEEENAKLSTIREHLAKETSTLKVDLAAEHAIAERLTEKWERCDADLQKAKAGPVWPWIVVGVAGALAIASGTVLAVALTRK